MVAGTNVKKKNAQKKCNQCHLMNTSLNLFTFDSTRKLMHVYDSLLLAEIDRASLMEKKTERERTLFFLFFTSALTYCRHAIIFFSIDFFCHYSVDKERSVVLPFLPMHFPSLSLLVCINHERFDHIVMQ